MGDHQGFLALLDVVKDYPFIHAALSGKDARPNAITTRNISYRLPSLNNHNHEKPTGNKYR